MSASSPASPDRRAFLQRGSALLLAAGLSPSALADLAASTPAPSSATPDATTPAIAALGWRVSVQNWTYRRVPLFDGLALAAEVGLRCFEPRSILKLDARRPGQNVDETMPDEARRELRARIDDLGISFPSVYADFNGQPDQAKRLLDFWQAFGVRDVVSEPPPKSVAMIQEEFAARGMRLALHNHQRTKSEYWHPFIVTDHCKDLGPHIGACCDVGQWTRSNLSPIESLRQLRGRQISFHLKDVLTKGDLDCRNTVIGEGAAECAACLAELKDHGYRGLVSIDFEHDTPDLQSDMRKNIAFIDTIARRLLA
jgi:sugar phosphate isomerase/epimerase